MLMRAPAQGPLPPLVSSLGLLSCVSYLVANEVRALNETLPTLIALEGPVTPLSPVTGIQRWVTAQGVSPVSLGQSSCLLKDQPLTALIGLLASMLALVLGQGGTVPKALPTVVALVGPLFRVSPQVQE